MPIFEYRCPGCGTKFEKLVRGETTAVACPQCGAEEVKKELSTFAAHARTGASSGTQPGPCGAGMCPTPGLCGRN